MTKKASGQVLKILGNILLFLFLLLCIFAVILTVSSKKDVDGASEIFGHQVRIVTSDSMASCEYTDVSKYKIKSIPVRSVVLIELVPDDEDAAAEWYSALKVGDVLTFRYVYNSSVTITHRITSILEKPDGSYEIALAGDNVNSSSGVLYQTIDTSDKSSPNYVIGKVTAKSYPLGVFLSFLKTPMGIALLIVLPCALIVLLEVIRIIRILGAERRRKDGEDAVTAAEGPEEVSQPQDDGQPSSENNEEDSTNIPNNNTESTSK